MPIFSSSFSSSVWSRLFLVLLSPTNSTALPTLSNSCLLYHGMAYCAERVLFNLLFYRTRSITFTPVIRRKGCVLFSSKDWVYRARTLLVERGCRKSRHPLLCPLMFFAPNKGTSRVQEDSQKNSLCLFFFDLPSLLFLVGNNLWGLVFCSTLWLVWVKGISPDAFVMMFCDFAPYTPFWNTISFVRGRAWFFSSGDGKFWGCGWRICGCVGTAWMVVMAVR